MKYVVILRMQPMKDDFTSSAQYATGKMMSSMKILVIHAT